METQCPVLLIRLCSGTPVLATDYPEVLKESVKFCNRKTPICAGQEHFHQPVKGMSNVIFIFSQINHKPTSGG